ncbi:DUF4190 domain-containing protein [Alkalibacillus almallahensis]|uniref:DUF4190 domain-containing protein n=1 Tax=Alkalibacillus almallahensis TaxID=1379154 RepID=UPI00141ECFB3|nr:hypothetical protein [Alkalibacillus almallahensis]NIK13075.1 heme/copper-type cytochrome/quinol oxidase subunit 2 [Alkalibacillus almallahensis]
MDSTEGQQQAPHSGLAIASLVIGVVSLVSMLVWTVMGMAVSVVGILFGVFAIGMIRKQKTPGLGLAKAGLFCNIVALVVPLVTVLVILIV